MNYFTTQNYVRNILVFLASVISMSVVAQTDIELTIKGIESDEGEIHAVVTEEKYFLVTDPDTNLNAQVAASEAKDGTVVVRIEDVPEGEYAITLFHDIDSNGKMKTNFIGMPKEPVAISRNPRSRFGPPKFKDAKLDVQGEIFKYTMEFNPNQFK